MTRADFRELSNRPVSRRDSGPAPQLSISLTDTNKSKSTDSSKSKSSGRRTFQQRSDDIEMIAAEINETTETFMRRLLARQMSDDDVWMLPEAFSPNAMSRVSSAPSLFSERGSYKKSISRKPGSPPWRGYNHQNPPLHRIQKNERPPKTTEYTGEPIVPRAARPKFNGNFTRKPGSPPWREHDDDEALPPHRLQIPETVKPSTEFNTFHTPIRKHSKDGREQGLHWHVHPRQGSPPWKGQPPPAPTTTHTTDICPRRSKPKLRATPPSFHIPGFHTHQRAQSRSRSQTNSIPRKQSPRPAVAFGTRVQPTQPKPKRHYKEESQSPIRLSIIRLEDSPPPSPRETRICLHNDLNSALDQAIAEVSERHEKLMEYGKEELLDYRIPDASPLDSPPEMVAYQEPSQADLNNHLQLLEQRDDTDSPSPPPLEPIDRTYHSTHEILALHQEENIYDGVVQEISDEDNLPVNPFPAADVLTEESSAVVDDHEGHVYHDISTDHEIPMGIPLPDSEHPSPKVMQELTPGSSKQELIRLGASALGHEAFPDPTSVKVDDSLDLVQAEPLSYTDNELINAEDSLTEIHDYLMNDEECKLVKQHRVLRNHLSSALEQSEEDLAKSSELKSIMEELKSEVAEIKREKSDWKEEQSQQASAQIQQLEKELIETKKILSIQSTTKQENLAEITKLETELAIAKSNLHQVKEDANRFSSFEISKIKKEKSMEVNKLQSELSIALQKASLHEQKSTEIEKIKAEKSAEISKLKQELNVTKDELSEELQTTKLKLSESKAELQSERQRVLNLEDSLKEQQAHYKGLCERASKEENDLSDRITELKQKIATSEAELQEKLALSEKEKYAIELIKKDAVDELTMIEEKKQKLVDEYLKQEWKIENLKKEQMTHTNQQYEAVKKELAAKQTELDKIKEELDHKSEEFNRLSNDIGPTRRELANVQYDLGRMEGQLQWSTERVEMLGEQEARLFERVTQLSSAVQDLSSSSQVGSRSQTPQSTRKNSSRSSFTKKKKVEIPPTQPAPTNHLIDMDSLQQWSEKMERSIEADYTDYAGGLHTEKQDEAAYPPLRPYETNKGPAPADPIASREYPKTDVPQLYIPPNIMDQRLFKLNLDINSHMNQALPPAQYPPVLPQPALNESKAIYAPSNDDGKGFTPRVGSSATSNEYVVDKTMSYENSIVQEHSRASTNKSVLSRLCRTCSKGTKQDSDDEMQI